MLQRQGYQVAKTAGRHSVLVRKKSVVGFEADVRVRFHGFCQDMRPKPSGRCCRDRFRKEYPDMSSVARTGALEHCWNALGFTGCQEGDDISLPCFLVKVCGKKPAGLISQHGINTDRKIPAIWPLSAQMLADDRICYGNKGAVWAIPAFDLGLATKSWQPFVGARWRIPGLSIP